MAKLLNEFEDQIEDIRVVPSGGGRFEVTVNGELLYSKLETGRHAEEDEIVQLVGGYLERAG